MQELQPLVGLIGVDDKLVVDRGDSRRAVAPNGMQCDLDAPQLETEHRGDALDALDHAGGDRRQKQFSRIEGIGPALETGVENKRGVLGRGQAASCIGPSGLNAIFEHYVDFLAGSCLPGGSEA